jgi:hypothetical protein
MKSNLTIGMCVEPGKLEFQALVFVRSLRAFGGEHSDARVILVSPRGKSFTKQMADLLEQAGCDLIVKDINTRYPDYNLANKPVGAAYIASIVDGEMWFLDCDTMILSDLSRLSSCLEFGTDTVLRSVWPGGFEGVGSYGPGDPNDVFWNSAYAMCGIKHEPYIWAPWAKKRIRGYWNSGVIISKNKDLYEEWLRCFVLLRESNLKLSKPYYQEQVSFALAMASLGLTTQSLQGVNAPIEQVSKTPKDDLYILHYAGPGQKKMFLRKECGNLSFADSGILKHSNGIKIIELIDESLKQNAMIESI